MFNVISALIAVTAAAPSLAANPQAATMPATPMAPAKARQIVVKCGLPDQRVSVSYEQHMQENVIWVAQADARLSETTLACVARASLRTIHHVFFREEAEQDRYASIYWAIENEMEVKEARAWLAKRKRVSMVPVPVKGSLAAYVEAVETFCGVRAGTLLVARSDDFITFAEGGLGRITKVGIEDAAATEEQFECVRKVMAAADLRSRGIFFGFIGNGASKGN